MPYKTYERYYSGSREVHPFTADDINKGHASLYTDYECNKCGFVQSVANMGGYGAPCMRCSHKSP
jgi:hypothetical protein